MEKHYKNLINVLFSVKGRYPNAIIWIQENSNDISIHFAKYEFVVKQSYDNENIYSIVVYKYGSSIDEFDGYDIRKYEHIEHIHIKLVKLIEEYI